MSSPNLERNKTLTTPTTNSQIIALLKKEGLALSKNNLPLYSLFDLFRSLTEKQKEKSKKHLSKIKTFIDFVIFKRSADVQKSLKDAIINNYETLLTDLDNDNLVFSNVLFQVFCFLFRFHVKLFTLTQSRLSRQSFGSSTLPSSPILFSEGVFFLLKKRLRSSPTPPPLPSTPVQTIKTLGNVKSLKIKKSPLNLPKQTNISSSQLDSQKPKRNKLKYNKKKIEPGFAQMDTKSTLEGLNVDKKKIRQNCRKIISQKNANGSLMNKNVGKLKFYNPIKEYGFIVLKDGGEVFVHKTDLVRSQIDVIRLFELCKAFDVFMAFDIEYYPGKNKMHRKAIKLRTVMLQNIDHY